MIRFLTGTITGLGNNAFNDFETMATGDVTQVTGEVESGNCALGEAEFLQR